MSFCTPLDWCPNLPVKVGQKTNPALEEDWLLMRLYAPSDSPSPQDSKDTVAGNIY